MKSLKEQLEARNESKIGVVPDDILAYQNQVTEDLKATDIEQKAVNVGDSFPDGEFLNVKNKKIMISSLLEKGKPTIINFYRGTWCPYCNIELAFYTELLKEEEGINMISISPEKPDVTMEKTDVDSLGFYIISDVDNKYAKQLNLVFDVPEKLVEIYKGFGIDLVASQGNENFELPLSGTYILDENCVVKKAWIDIDYTKRAEPEEVIKAYKESLK